MDQGEDDTTTLAKAENYACTFPRMIQDWRAGWSASSGTSPTFPFGLVQLCSWAHGNATAPKNATVRVLLLAAFQFCPSQFWPGAQACLPPPRAFVTTLTSLPLTAATVPRAADSSPA